MLTIKKYVEFKIQIPSELSNKLEIEVMSRNNGSPGLFLLRMRERHLMQRAPYAEREVQHMPGIAEDSKGTSLQ